MRPYQVCCLCVFFWSLLQATVRSPDSPITFIHESEDVGFIFHLETREYRIIGVSFPCLQELGLQPFSMGLWARPEVHFLSDTRTVSRHKDEKGAAGGLTVFVNSVCGHVPHRKFRQTFSSDQTRFAFATPIASGPIICYGIGTNVNTLELQKCEIHTSKSFLCISARRPIFYFLQSSSNVYV